MKEAIKNPININSGDNIKMIDIMKQYKSQEKILLILMIKNKSLLH